MGACTFVITGETKAEVRRKLNERLTEAKHHGLYEDRRSDVTFNPKEQQYTAVLRVHR